MKSKITIEVDFDLNTPYIRVINIQSDDVRDKLIQAFRHKFNYCSSWAKIVYDPNWHGEEVIFSIFPIGEAQLEKEAEIMSEQVRLNKERPTVPEVT